MKVSYIFLILLLFAANLPAQTPRLNAIKVLPETIEGGKAVDVYIHLDRPGFAGPAINSSNQNVAPFAGLAPNRNNQPVIIKKIFTKTVNSKTVVTLSASWNGRTRSTDLTVLPKAPPAVTLSSPNNNYTDHTGVVTLHWNAAARATSYELCVRKANYTGACGNNASARLFTTTGTQYTASQNSGQIYSRRKAQTIPFRGEWLRWHVHAVNEGGKSPQSAQRNLMISLPSATLVSPAPNATVTTRRPVFTWQAVSGATMYQVKLQNSSGQVAQFTVNSGAQTSFQPVADIAINGQAYWSVNARNAVADFGQPQNSDQLRSITLPAAGASFAELFDLFKHPRCTSCHNFNLSNGLRYTTHANRSTSCNSCHFSNFTGVSNWQAPPTSMALQNVMSNATAMCNLIQSNSNFNEPEEMRHHFHEDDLILWAIDNGKVPKLNAQGNVIYGQWNQMPTIQQDHGVSRQQWFDKTDEWIDGGMQCQ